MKIENFSFLSQVALLRKNKLKKSVNPSENDFVECLTAVLAPMDEPPVELPCQVAVDAFNDNYGTSFTPLELAVLLGGFDDDLCGDQEAFEEAVFIHLHPWLEFIAEEAFAYFLENPENIAIIEDNNNSGNRRIPCFTWEDFTYIGDAVYLNFFSYQYEWYQHSTTLTYSTNWQHFCLQFPNRYSITATESKLETALELALDTAEAACYYLENLRIQAGQPPIIEEVEIKAAYEYSLQSVLAGVFGGGVSINTAPNGCPGVPITLFDTNC